MLKLPVLSHIPKFPTLATPENDKINGRQIAFFAAFVLPVYKLLELPSILSGFMGGDLLLPAFLQYLFQTGVLLALLFVCSRSQTPLFERLEKRFGKWTAALYLLYSLYFLFACVLPLLDLDKFVYAVFYDTAPTFFSFLFFFFISAYVCSRGIKMLGRMADLSLFLFLAPFFALIAMSLAEADASNLLPIFQHRLEHTLSAFTYTTPHFSDAILLLPLLGNLRYQKGDTKKIAIGYGFGGVLTLLFLGVFYGVYSTLASREHYAIAKIAQYFPALTVIGRIDLLLVYLICVVLFIFVATPLHYAADFTARTIGGKGRVWFAALFNLAALLFTLFCNQHYNAVYTLFGRYLFPVFWLFADILPLLLLLLTLKKDKPKNAEKTGKGEKNYA